MGEEISNKVRIIFGGKVDENNCKELILLKDVDGFLVGEPSIKSAFMDIIYSSKLKKWWQKYIYFEKLFFLMIIEYIY